MTEKANEKNLAIKMHLPWSDEVVKGNFPILIRTIHTNIRGLIWIMASQSFDPYALRQGYSIESYENLFGKIIGTIEIVKIESVPKTMIMKRLLSDVNKNFSDWYPRNFIPLDNQVYFWYLKNATKFKKPFPMKRKGGYVWVRLTQEEIESLKNWK